MKRAKSLASTIELQLKGNWSLLKTFFLELFVIINNTLYHAGSVFVQIAQFFYFYETSNSSFIEKDRIFLVV